MRSFAIAASPPPETMMRAVLVLRKIGKWSIWCGILFVVAVLNIGYYSSMALYLWLSKDVCSNSVRIGTDGLLFEEKWNERPY